MSSPLVIDSTVLIDIDRGDRDAWLRLKRFVARKGVPLVPTVALAQAWRGPRHARLGHALGLCRTIALDASTARGAGELCARSGTSDVVDAAIVAMASRNGGYVWSDDPDIGMLTQHLPPTMGSVIVRIPD
jgi:hypothetical protein